ncbi:uncharacterized protein LOC131925668 [Peromyscus eremicus]|uniref:uncharacterized protein LOC131925668 n=1 Tax=Peromyscus eremicus TaxID=42410 RepID=UPI0027DBF7E6|nr:uncharacterized protein LOC131925668 [Peromyscus eremicus]
MQGAQGAEGTGCGGLPPTHSKPAREHPGLARGRRSSLCLLRRPGVFPEAPQTLAREGRLQPGFPGKRSAAPFPRVPRGHREWQLLIAAEGCWSCGGRHLIPCPILECYSVTYNRVTRAAADVPDASIGHRNKEGRVPGLGLYNPELCSSVIGSKVPRQEGIGVREAGLPLEIRCCGVLGALRSSSNYPGTKVQFPGGGGAAVKTRRCDSEKENQSSPLCVLALRSCDCKLLSPEPLGAWLSEPGSELEDSSLASSRSSFSPFLSLPLPWFPVQKRLPGQAETRFSALTATSTVHT